MRLLRCGRCGGSLYGETQADGWEEYRCLLCGREAHSQPSPELRERIARARREMDAVKALPPPRRGRPAKAVAG